MVLVLLVLLLVLLLLVLLLLLLWTLVLVLVLVMVLLVLLVLVLWVAFQDSNTAGQQHDGTVDSNTARKQHVKMARQQDSMTKIQQRNNLTIQQPMDVARRNARSD